MPGAAPHPLADPRWLAAARRRPALWRLAIGLALALAIYAGTLAALAAGLAFAFGPGRAEAAMRALGAGEAPGAVLALLATIAAMALAAWAAARALHGRHLGEMTGPRAPALRDFRLAAGITLAVNLPLLALALGAIDLSRALDPAAWALLLVPAIPLIALQTGAEELLFRGYLQGQLAARFRSPLAWAVLPSLAFGAAHWDAAGGPSAWGIVAATALFGLAAADLTALTGRLGAAWGLHFANNLVALTVIGTPGALPGLALWRTPWTLEEAPGGLAILTLDMAALVLVWALVRRALVARLQRAGAANTPPGRAAGERQ